MPKRNEHCIHCILLYVLGFLILFTMVAQLVISWRVAFSTEARRESEPEADRSRQLFNAIEDANKLPAQVREDESK